MDRLGLLCILGTIVMALAVPEARAQAPGAPLAVGETNVSGLVAEVTECKRKEGVLSVKVRFRNTSGETVLLNMIRDRDYDKQYVTAGNKKYLVLRDTEKTPLASPADNGGAIYANIEPNGTWTWWAKYPAPPPEVSSVSYYTTVAPPIEDVPITDP
jgi:hypothetical protein